MVAGDSIQVVESRSGKETVMVMNRWAYEALRSYLEWAKAAKVQGRYGAGACTRPGG